MQKHFPGWMKRTTTEDQLLSMVLSADPEDFRYNDSGARNNHGEVVRAAARPDLKPAAFGISGRLLWGAFCGHERPLPGGQELEAVAAIARRNQTVSIMRKMVALL